jgi:hypothetical protein
LSKCHGAGSHLIVAASRLPRQVPVPIEGVELKDVAGERGRARRAGQLGLVRLTGGDASMTGGEQESFSDFSLEVNFVKLFTDVIYRFS